MAFEELKQRRSAMCGSGPFGQRILDRSAYLLVLGRPR